VLERVEKVLSSGLEQHWPRHRKSENAMGETLEAKIENPVAMAYQCVIPNSGIFAFIFFPSTFYFFAPDPRHIFSPIPVSIPWFFSSLLFTSLPPSIPPSQWPVPPLDSILSGIMTAVLVPRERQSLSPDPLRSPTAQRCFIHDHSI
jgi:hypothetical protein